MKQQRGKPIVTTVVGTGCFAASFFILSVLDSQRRKRCSNCSFEAATIKIAKPQGIYPNSQEKSYLPRNFYCATDEAFRNAGPPFVFGRFFVCF